MGHVVLNITKPYTLIETKYGCFVTGYLTIGDQLEQYTENQWISTTKEQIEKDIETYKFNVAFEEALND